MESTADKSPYISDPKLVPRIITFLHDEWAAKKGKSAGSTDPQCVADHLQSTFSEYRRRKQKAFFQLVLKGLQVAETEMKKQPAYKEHLSKSSACSPKTGSKRQRQEQMGGDSDSNEEDLVCYKDTNAVNNSLRNLYKESSRLQSPLQQSPLGEVQAKVKTKVLTRQNEPSVQQTPTGTAPLWYVDRGGSQSGNASAGVKTPVLMEISEPLQETEIEMVQSPSSSSKHSISKKKVRKHARDKEIDIKKEVAGVMQLNPTVNFSEFVGHDKMLMDLSDQLELFHQPELYSEVDITPNRGILLHGPPGCGKSHLANCIAGHLSVPLLEVPATALVSGVSGESEKNIRQLFEQALTSAPCVLFIDNIESVAANTENANKEMERRMTMQLMSCMDGLKSRLESILVIGATRRPDSVDRALRIQGRFGMEIALGIPDEKTREAILRNLSKKMTLSPNIDLKAVAKATPGFLGGDLNDVKRQAGLQALKRLTRLSRFKLRSIKGEVGGKDNSISQESSLWNEPLPPAGAEGGDILWSEEEKRECLTIMTEDFMKAIKKVQPSALREGFATVPDVTWDDVGAMRDVRDVLDTAILGPARYPEVFARLGMEVSSGVLLVGPPGCGKTLVAKAIANETGINFISVKGPELMNMYVGESERAVRQVFERARNSAPCVIFFDELDSLCPRRSDQENQSSARVVNQLLTEMDGLESRKHVYIMAATNRLDILDPAVLRPGRLGKVVHVPMPSSQDRYEIFCTITKNGTRPCLSEDVDLRTIAESPKCEGFSGADLKALVEEAATVAVKEFLKSDQGNRDKVVVTKGHIDKALETVRPSVSRETQAKYVRSANKQW